MNQSDYQNTVIELTKSEDSLSYKNEMEEKKEREELNKNMNNIKLIIQ